MHKSAYHIGGLALRIYADVPGARVLEIGSQNINGALRDYKRPDVNYVGTDMNEGPGVDLVVPSGCRAPFDDDLVLASSVFEHYSAFWLTFVEMCRLTSPGGYVYIKAPSNGSFHRYPVDNWRFYPDAGVALQSWGRREGQEITLVESFIGEQDEDVWNDLVAVWRKEDPAASALPATLISDQVPCTNVRTFRAPSVERVREEGQDMALMRGLNGKVAGLAGDLRRVNEEMADLRIAKANADKQAQRMKDELAAIRASRSWRVTAPLRALCSAMVGRSGGAL